MYLRFVLAFLFLSTAWSKLKAMGEHIGIVKDYQILPEAWVRSFARAETYFELAVGLLLLSGWLPAVAAAAAIGLLLTYTAAISINLLRGRTEVSCGCGGAAGDHQLSWGLVVRNLVLIALAAAVAVAAGQGGVQTVTAGVLLLASVVTMVLWTSVNELLSTRGAMRAILKGRSNV